MEKILAIVSSIPSGPVGYLIIFGILLACGLGIPIPEDLSLIAGGYISYKGYTNVHIMFVVSMIGVLLGDSIIFWLGKNYGPRLAKKWFFKKILSPQRLALVSQKLQKQGSKIIFAARFMPGFRAPVYFSAGTLGYSYKVFLFYDGLAAILSVPAIIYSVYFFGDQIEEAVGWIKRVEHGIILVITTILCIVLVKWLINRRRLQAS